MLPPLVGRIPSKDFIVKFFAKFFFFVNKNNSYTFTNKAKNISELRSEHILALDFLSLQFSAIMLSKAGMRVVSSQ